LLGEVVNWRRKVKKAHQENDDNKLSFCLAKSWLLEHMPEFDLNYLPPSVCITVFNVPVPVSLFLLF
jgi:hypothetical protein